MDHDAIQRADLAYQLAGHFHVHRNVALPLLSGFASDGLPVSHFESHFETVCWAVCWGRAVAAGHLAWRLGPRFPHGVSRRRVS